MTKTAPTLEWAQQAIEECRRERRIVRFVVIKDDRAHTGLAVETRPTQAANDVWFAALPGAELRIYGGVSRVWHPAWKEYSTHTTLLALAAAAPRCGWRVDSVSPTEVRISKEES